MTRICPRLFNHSPTEGHLDYLLFGAITSKAFTNICVQGFCEHKFLFL